MEASQKLSDALTGFGFSRYEARVYSGLLAHYGQTAYALARSTGVPTPKIYEALQKLIERGAAVSVDESPQKFAAVPLDQLLARFEREHAGRLAAARAGASELAAEGRDGGDYAELVRSVGGLDRIMAEASRLIAGATGKLYLSGWGAQLETLASVVEAAEKRAVNVIALAFGKTSFAVESGRTFRHRSTSHGIYLNHQHRHLAVVADGQHALWALAPNGDDWSGILLDDFRLVGLVRTFVRHDIYVQQIYAHLQPELIELFGPGLELLTDLNRTPDPSDVSTNARRAQSAG